MPELRRLGIMERLVEGLTKLVSRGLPSRAPRARRGDTGNGPATPRELSVDLGAAPESVKKLAEALTTNYFLVRLGKLSMYENGGTDEVGSLESTLDQACENGGIAPAWARSKGGADGGAFDPAQTIELGADGGGMSYIGVTWSGGTLRLVLVELADPVEDNLLRHFTTPEEFFAFLDEIRDADDEEPKDLTELKAAAAS